MYNNHKAVVDMIKNHYHVYNCRQLSDLDQKNQRQLANLILQDFDYFDPAEIILYNPNDKNDHNKVNNMIKLLDQIFHGIINEKDFINEFYKLVLNEKTESTINEIFEEIIDSHEIKSIDSNWQDKMDAILGFI